VVERCMGDDAGPGSQSYAPRYIMGNCWTFLDPFVWAGAHIFSIAARGRDSKVASQLRTCHRDARTTDSKIVHAAMNNYKCTTDNPESYTSTLTSFHSFTHMYRENMT